MLRAPAPHLDGVGSVYSDLVIGGVAVLDAQVKILYVQVQVWQDELDPTTFKCVSQRDMTVLERPYLASCAAHLVLDLCPDHPVAHKSQSSFHKYSAIRGEPVAPSSPRLLVAIEVTYSAFHLYLVRGSHMPACASVNAVTTLRTEHQHHVLHSIKLAAKWAAESHLLHSTGVDLSHSSNIFPSCKAHIYDLDKHAL